MQLNQDPKTLFCTCHDATWLKNWLKKLTFVHILSLSSFCFPTHVNYIDYFQIWYKKNALVPVKLVMK